MNPATSTRQDIQKSSSGKNLRQAVGGIAIFIAVSLALTYSRISHPAFGMQGDLPLHYHITRSLAQSFVEGDPLPRWAGLLDGGRGDALFTFYPPLSYLSSAILMKLFGLDALVSMRIVLVFILILAQASAYGFARRFFDHRRSVLVSLFYVLAPFLPLIALNRGFFANAMALGFAPLALLGAHQTLAGDRRGPAVFAFGTSAVILTHVIATYLCGIAIGLMALLCLPKTGWRGLARLAAASALVFALTAFFLVPQQIEMNWVQVGLQLAQQDYRNYLMFAKAQDNSNYRQAWAGMNQILSYATIGQTLIAALLGAACWPLLRKKEAREQTAFPLWFGLSLAAFGLLISLPFFGFVWRYLPGLKYIQFPWRFHPFVALGGGLLAAAARDSKRLLKPLPRALLAVALTWLVVPSLILTFLLVQLKDPNTRAELKSYLESPDAPPVSIEEGRRIQGDDDLKFMPYAANQVYFRPNGADLMLYSPASQPGGLSLARGECRVVSQKIEIARREFSVQCPTPAEARIETYRYPHWVARLDEQEIAIKADPGTGLMLIDLPAGTHRLRLDYEVRNVHERAARLLSIVAWLLFVGWLGLKLVRG
jgi:hypothetical protein